MGRFNQIKNSFGAGEIGPRSYGRTEVKEYFEGAAELENGLISSQGGFVRRGGTQFIAKQINFGAGNVALSGYYRTIPVKLGNGARYLLVLDPTNSKFAVVSATNGGAVTLTHSGTYTVVPTPRGVIMCGASNAYNLDETETKELNYKQVGNVLYLVHKGYWPFWFNFTDVDVAGTGVTYGTIYDKPSSIFTTLTHERTPFFDPNSITAATITPSGTTGSITLTMGSWVYPYTKPSWWSYSVLLDNVVGSIIRLNDGAVLVTSRASATVVNATVLDALSGTGATADWELSMWGTQSGFPSCIEYFQGRLYYSGVPGIPDNVQASESFDVTQMSLALGGSIVDSSPYNFTLSDAEPQTVKWLVGGKTLNIGTTEAEYSIYGPDQNASISATNIDTKKETSKGSAPLAGAIRTENALYFVDKSGSKVREYVFDDREQSFQSRNLNVLADHIFDVGKEYRLDDTSGNYPFEFNVEVEEIHAEKSGNAIWFLDNYHNLISLHIDRQNNVAGFVRHKIGGSLDNNDVPKVHSIAVLPPINNSDIVGEEVYMMVERTINSAAVTYLEKMAPPFKKTNIAPFVDVTDDYSDELPIYVDSALVVADASGMTSVSGLSHLEGETVQVLADGKYIGTFTVASGAISSLGANQSPTIVIVGLSYTTKVKMLPIEGGAVLGSSFGSVRDANEITMRFNRTIAAKYGISEDSLDNIIFRPADLALQDPIPMFSGIKKVQLPYQGEEQQLIITCDKPVPFELVSVSRKGITYE